MTTSLWRRVGELLGSMTRLWAYFLSIFFQKHFFINWNREDRLGLLPHLRPPADPTELRPVDIAVARCLLRGVELTSHLTADFSFSFNGVVISLSRSLLAERNRDWLIYHFEMNAIVCVNISTFSFFIFLSDLYLFFFLTNIAVLAFSCRIWRLCLCENEPSTCLFFSCELLRLG